MCDRCRRRRVFVSCFWKGWVLVRSVQARLQTCNISDAVLVIGRMTASYILCRCVCKQLTRLFILDLKLFNPEVMTSKCGFGADNGTSNAGPGAHFMIRAGTCPFVRRVAGTSSCYFKVRQFLRSWRFRREVLCLSFFVWHVFLVLIGRCSAQWERHH